MRSIVCMSTITNVSTTRFPGIYRSVLKYLKSHAESELVLKQQVVSIN